MARQPASRFRTPCPGIRTPTGLPRSRPCCSTWQAVPSLATWGSSRSSGTGNALTPWISASGASRSLRTATASTRRSARAGRPTSSKVTSPAGTRLAFKKRVGGGVGESAWRFHVLELATMTETPLAETRSIDDQIEWLDDRNVLYQVAQDIWTVPADGSGEPRKFMWRAVSPAVIHTGSTPFTASPKKAQILTLAPSDVAVTMSARPNPARVGEELTYMVTVSNNGPATATDVGIDVLLPPAATFGAFGRVSPPGTPHSCSFQDGYVSCAVEKLQRGESLTIEFTVRPTAQGQLRQRVTVGGVQPDPARGNDSATVETTVIAREGALR